MIQTQSNSYEVMHHKLREFLSKWTLEKVKQMTLEEYSDVGNKDTFCYWLEFGTEDLGIISGKPSNKFGIWKRKTDKEIVSKSFLFDKNYAWYRKYGNNAEEAFLTVRNNIVNVIQNSQSGNFSAIDGIDLDSLARWKIAFIYSNYSLLPIYKKERIRKIAKHYQYQNYDKARISDLYTFILKQKKANEDFFDFSRKQNEIALKEFERNYYILGSKYEDDNSKKYEDVIEYMIKKNVVSTGYFGEIALSHLYLHTNRQIHKWCDENIIDKSGKYDAAKRTLGYFLQLRVGDIIAIKSQGLYNHLTIVAYAEVKEVDGKVYEYDGGDFPNGLGHTVHVNFHETNIKIATGLNYAETIHKVIPFEKDGHFEKIFGSYALLERIENENEATEDDVDISIEEDRINEKQTDVTYRTVFYTALVSKVHNKIQIAFAKFLKAKFPADTIRTESDYIDIKRENENEIYYYEVKPYNSAYTCIREGIGQLLDYCYSNPVKSKTIHLRIVGNAIASPDDLEFIEFVKKNLNISFDYITFNY